MTNKKEVVIIMKSLRKKGFISEIGLAKKIAKYINNGDFDKIVSNLTKKGYVIEDDYDYCQLIITSPNNKKFVTHGFNLKSIQNMIEI